MKNTILHFPTDEYIQRVVKTHLDPNSGSVYWRERDRRFGAHAFQHARTFEDFKKLVGFRDLDDQRSFEQHSRFSPVEDLIPKAIMQSERWIWVSQTGGTTGVPKNGCWDSLYWNHVLEFSDEFLDLHGVPRGLNWLFIGPTGPHTTGRLIISIAERRGGKCFSIDLDPRIVKIFGTEGMHAAYNRYVQHIWDQVRPLIQAQKIGILFCTSRLLEMLPEYIDPRLFSGIRAIVHAGTSMERDAHYLLATNVFPEVAIIGIYGTSTTGISYQKPPEQGDDYRIIYIPSSPFIVLEVVDEEGRTVGYNEEGQVSTYRLTEDFLIPGFWERDRAKRVKPFGAFSERYPWDWIENVYSPEFTVEGKVEGVY